MIQLKNKIINRGPRIYWINPDHIYYFFAEEKRGGPLADDPGSQIYIRHTVLTVKETPEEIIKLIQDGTKD